MKATSNRLLDLRAELWAQKRVGYAEAAVSSGVVVTLSRQSRSERQCIAKSKTGQELNTSKGGTPGVGSDVVSTVHIITIPLHTPRPPC